MPALKGKQAKQELFCKEYIKDFNGARAARDSGYSKKTAEVQASRLLISVKVKERLAELLESRNKEVKVDAEYVLKRLKEIDELDITDILDENLEHFKPLTEWPKAWRISISGFDLMTIRSKSDSDDMESFIKKIKWPDKTKNLELLGKHVNVSAFSEQLNVTNTNNLTPWGSVTAGVDEPDS